MDHPSESRIPWPTLSVAECFQRLPTGPAGLGEEEAARRLREWGPHELEPPRRISPLAILLAQFRNIRVLILPAATALSVALGHGTEAVVIMIIGFFSLLLGFVQEYRAERALEALRRMAAPMTTVLRAGDRVPADFRDPGGRSGPLASAVPALWGPYPALRPSDPRAAQRDRYPRRGEPDAADSLRGAHRPGGGAAGDPADRRRPVPGSASGRLHFDAFPPGGDNRWGARRGGSGMGRGSPEAGPSPIVSLNLGT